MAPRTDKQGGSFFASDGARAAVGLGVTAAILGLLGSVPAAGQLWQGPAAVGVEVKGKGGPVAGAEVVLRYLEVLPESGPPALTTDDSGEAVAYGLAEGSWQLDVRHPDHARYFAVIRLQAGKRPVITSGPVRHVEGLPLKLKLFKPEVREAAPVEEGPPPEEAPAEPSTTGPRGTPSPRGGTEPPELGAELRVFGMHSCPDCRPGEWAFSAQRVAATAGGEDAACDGVPEPIEEAVGLVAQLLEEAGGQIAGPLVSPANAEVIALPDPEVRARVAELLRPWAVAAGSCQLVGVVLPADARYSGYRYQARDTGRSGDCVGSQECDIGGCGWSGHPAVERAAGGTVVYGLFQNRSASRQRVGKLTVYFMR